MQCVCEKLKTGDAVFQVSGKANEYCCFTCAPELCFIDCTVCGHRRPSEDFRGHARKVVQQTVRRCTRCSDCKTCGQSIQDFRKFVCNTRQCVKCAREKMCNSCNTSKPLLDFPKDVASNPRRYGNADGQAKRVCLACCAKDSPKTATKECSSCDDSKPIGDFPEDVAKNPGRYGNGVHQIKLVCLRCREEGYSHKNLYSYTCELCGPLGHAKFDASDIPTAPASAAGAGAQKKQRLLPSVSSREEEKKHVLCVACKNKHGTCDVASCKELKKCFDPHIFANARKYDRALVCSRCQSKGFSPKDLKRYTGVCGDLGHLKFDYESLKNYKKRSSPLLCNICRNKNTQLKQKLKCSLAKPNAWKCSCPGSGIHKPHQVFNEKCGLHPARASDKRWPGGNVGFDNNHCRFLQQAHKYQKKSDAA